MNWIHRMHLLAAFGALAIPASGQDARELLRMVADRYRELEAYHIEADVSVVSITAVGEQAFDVHVLMAERPPAYLRAEVHGQSTNMIVVTNDAGSWMYMPTLNQYVHEMNSAPANAGAMADDLLGEYERLDARVVTARIVGRERVAMDGQSRSAIVVDAIYEPASTPAGADSTRKKLWIDPSLGLVLRDETSAYVARTPYGDAVRIQETTLFTHVFVGEPPLSLFEFEPPEHAERVDPATLRGPTDRLQRGEAAPDFDLPSPDGGEGLRLSDLRGEVVLVNFWATWCGPCRVEMPELEQLHIDYRDEGLHVLGVNMGEPRGLVREYLAEQRLTFPILLDENAAVGGSYRTHSLPTSVVVDREGRVSSVLVGAQTAEIFLHAIREAGL